MEPINKEATIREADKQYVWHPFTIVDKQESALPIARASGSRLFDYNGTSYFDAISSWWVNIHGHAHPYLAKKIYEQFLEMEHVIFAGFTHEKAVELAERLLHLLPDNQDKVFFSDNGSTAVEVAVKIALQYWHNKQLPKTRVVAFEQAYHGDTFGAMSVSGRSLFTEPFHDFMFHVEHVPVPVKGMECIALERLSGILNTGNVAAFIFEPLVLGAGGMLMYEPDVLNEMLTLCHQHSVLCIADEVMTGFGRTGTFFATEQVHEKPDIFCLSKGITGGSMPLGITTVSQTVYEAFKSSEPTHTFWHGHSYTGNALACAVACASLDLFEQEHTLQKIRSLQENIFEHISTLRREPFADIRQTGTIAAFEFKTEQKTGYTNKLKKNLSSFFIDRGILVRPLGNVLYLMPPYCTSFEEIQHFFKVLEAFSENRLQ